MLNSNSGQKRLSGGVARASDNPNTSLARGETVSDREGDGSREKRQSDARGRVCDV